MEYTIRPTRLEDMEGFNVLRRMPGVFENTMGLPSERVQRNIDGFQAMGPDDHSFVAVLPDGTMALGGKGVISVLSNVAPRQAHDMCEKFFEGEVAGSCKLQLDAIPLVDALFCEVNPIPVKKAMNLMGLEAGPLRRPLTEMEEANAAKLEAAMKDYGLL